MLSKLPWYCWLFPDGVLIRGGNVWWNLILECFRVCNGCMVALMVERGVLKGIGAYIIRMAFLRGYAMVG